MPGKAGRRALGVLAAAAVIGVFAWVAWPTWDSVVDDAYISARYAENLADGNGLVYSAGEPPVEGYTNLLWTVLLAVGRRLGLPIVGLMTGLGFAFGALTIGFATALARRLAQSGGEPRGGLFVAAPVLAAGATGVVLALPIGPVLGATVGGLALLGLGVAIAGRRPGAPGPTSDALLLGPALVMALSPHLAVASTNGIESSMMSAMVAGTLWAHLTFRERGRWIAGLLAAALVLTRPEGVAIAGLVGLHDVWLHRRALGRAIPLTGTAALTTVALFAWRYATYGDLLPNTFHAKSSFSLPETFEVNAAYFTDNQGALTGLAVLWAVAALLPPYRLDKALVSLVALVLGVVPFTVNLWMPALRLYLSTGALVAALIGAALLRAPRWIGRAGAVAGVIGMLVYLGPTAPKGTGGAKVRAYDGRHTVQPGNGAEVAARLLAEHAPADAWLATRDAGVLAYYVGTHTKVAELHQRALTQPHPDGANTDPRTYTPNDPAFFIATVQRKEATEFTYGQDKAVWRRMKKPYVYLGRVEQHYHRYYDVYARADLGVPPLPDGVVLNHNGPKPPKSPGAAAVAEPLPDTGL